MNFIFKIFVCEKMRNKIIEEYLKTKYVEEIK